MMNIAVKPTLHLQEESSSFRAAMRSFAGSVSVITAGAGDERAGLTASSVSSLSLEPPTVIVAVNRQASAWPVIARRRQFCVNLLGEDDRLLAERFAGRGGVAGSDRYAGASWITLATGAPALEHAVAVLDCAIEETIERHTHAIVIGRVQAILLNGGSPLLYADGRFGRFEATTP